MKFKLLLTISLSMLFSTITHSFEVIHQSVEKELIIKDQTIEKKLTIQLPGSVTKVGRDLDKIFLFKPAQKSISVLSYHDLVNVNGRVDMVNFAEIDLQDEFQGKRLIDFAVRPLNGAVILYVTSRSSVSNKTNLKSFVIYKDQDGASEETEGYEAAEVTSNGIVALRSKENEILGDGNIEIIHDPHSSSAVLLSIDRSQKLLHEYNVEGGVEAIFSNTYSLSNIKENIASGNFSISNLMAPYGSIFLNNGTDRYSLSIIRLRKEQMLKRYAFMTNWNREVIGNTWTKQLLGWGMFSSLINYIDEVFTNPELDVEALLQDPEMKLITDKVSDREVFAWAESSNLFSNEELDQMRLEYGKKRFKGRKWFVTCALFAGLLTYTKVRGSAKVTRDVGHIAKSIYGLATSVLRKLGVSNAKIAAADDFFKNFKNRFRGRLLQNYENQKHPLDLIQDLEKRMNRVMNGSASQPLIDVKLAKKASLSDRAKRILDIWNDMSDDFAKKMGDNVTALADDVEKLGVLEQQIAVGNRLTQAKSRILVILEQNGKGIGTRTDDAIDFIKSGSREEVIQMLDKVKKLNRGGRYDDLIRRTTSYLDELDEITETMSNWSRQNFNVPKFYDWWARNVSSRYARFYFLPENAGKNKVLGWLERNARMDRIMVNGELKKIAITAEDVKTAFTVGKADILGDIAVQYLSRKDVTDPNERIWGTGANFVDFIPWKGKQYGVHFDLIGSFLGQVFGWFVAMPLSYARMGMASGGKGGVSYLGRWWDGQKKSLNPVNFFWGIGHSTVWWKTAGGLALLDYKIDAGDNFNQEEYDALKAQIDGRLVSFKGIGGRMLFNKSISSLYISPQYWIQGEFNKVASLITGGSRLGDFVGTFVMPVTTGWFIHKWWADYFGFNNPDMIKLLQKFNAEGILSKIDNNGYTNLQSWTVHEREVFTQLVVMLEMARYEKEQPLPQGDPAALAEWYGQIYENLFGTNVPEETVDASEIPERVRVVANPDQADGECRYAKEANELVATFERVADTITYLPFKKAGNNNTLAVRVNNIDQNLSNVEMESLLNEAISLNATISDLMYVTSQNRSVLSSLQNKAHLIALVDTLVIADMMLFNHLPTKMQNITRGWNALVKRVLRGTATAGTLMTLPGYFWLRDQTQSHLRNAMENSRLLKDLQELVLKVTESLVIQQMMVEFSEMNTNGFANKKLYELQQTLDTKLDDMKNNLSAIQIENDALRTKRIYRWSRILNSYAPMGMIASGAWIGVRKFLFTQSKGFIEKMVDRSGMFLLKFSFLAWFYTGQRAEEHSERIALTTHDFFVFHSLYQMTMMEKVMVDELIRHQEGRTNGGDLLEQVRTRVESDEFLREMSSYREELLKMVNAEEGH